MVKQCGLLTGGIQALLICAFPAEAVVIDLIRKFHPRALRKELHRINKGKAFDLADELDRAPARMAAKAIVHLLVRLHGKRRGFLVVERAAAPKPAALLRKRHIFGNERNDIRLLKELVHPCFREHRHTGSLLSILYPPFFRTLVIRRKNRNSCIPLKNQAACSRLPESYIHSFGTNFLS